MRTGRPERLKGFPYVGRHRYFLTFCTSDRHAAFVDAGAVNIARSHILRTAAEEGFAVIAYCLMPDHMHLLIEGLDDRADCRRYISRSKQYSGFYYQQAFGRRLWQKYVYERTLRSEDESLAVARYIIDNPLRAGLARRIDEYPYVGSQVYPLEAILEAVQTWRPHAEPR